jgi:hypothetical protein
MLSEPRQWHMISRLAMETRFHFDLTSQTREISCRYSGSSRQSPRPAAVGSVAIFAATSLK